MSIGFHCVWHSRSFAHARLESQRERSREEGGRRRESLVARDFGLYSKCRKDTARGKGEKGEGEGENCGNWEESYWIKQ